MARLSILARMVILQCLLCWCRAQEETYRLESFKRLDKKDRFLKAEWNEQKKAFDLSFTGFITDLGTTFIFKHENNSQIKPFTIHLAERPDYTLAVEEQSLVVKTLPPDVTMRSDMSKYKFLTKRIALHYSDNGKLKKPDYHVIQSQAFPFKKVKSTKSGKVSLTFNWKECGAWIGFNETSK